jgi:hypothetical protein
MKNIWKWILGILAVLIVIAAVGGLAFVFLRSRMMAANFRPGYGFQQPQQQQLPNGDQPSMPGWRHGGNNYGFGFGHSHESMMGGGERGFGRFGGMPFGRGFMFLGGFIHLVIFGLLLYGAYWLGRRNARIALDPKPVAPAQEPKPVAAAKTPKKK